MNPPRIPLAFLLPLINMLVWVLLIAVPITMAVLHLRAVAHGAPVVDLQFGQFSMHLRRSGFLSFAADHAAFRWAHSLTALNVPGLAGEVLLSHLMKTWPMSWSPAGIMVDSWRAISYPILCLPFWWFAGLGLESVLVRRQIRWPVLLVGTVLCIAFFVLLIGLRFAMSALERGEMVYPLWGFGLWAVLLLPYPTMWAHRGASAMKRKRARKLEGSAMSD